MIQKKIPVSVLIIMAIIIGSCGPSQEEQQRREQARLDSLEQVRQDSIDRLRRQRQDSIAQAQQDTANESEMNNQENRANVSFAPNGRFSIQVEAWRSEQKARSQADAWKERGFQEATVVQYGNKATGDVWFRVRLGKLESRQAAEQVQQTLQEQYQTQSWIATN